jgi:nucleoside-diphosphate-sugar epimerase
MAKVFITGITGFLGSSIAGYLVKQGHSVSAIYRRQSSLKLCESYFDEVKWIIQTDDDSWIHHVIDMAPKVIIHAAWLGVEHHERDNWESQLNNINFLKTILTIAGKVKADKFIALGSQAEYGVYNGCINESQPLNAVEAYGCVKVICSELVKQYCNYHKINWYWLRLFSFFGENEADAWLIPSLVKKVLHNESMDLTPGEQKYTYLYVDDLGLAVNKIIAYNGLTGFYNISGKKLITIKSLIEGIRDKINSSFKLNFGKLSYRENQSMHMQGDSSKFINEFGEFEVSDFETSMDNTIKHLVTKFNGQQNESI